MIISPVLYILKTTFTGILISILFEVVLHNGMFSLFFIFIFVITLNWISFFNYFSLSFNYIISLSLEPNSVGVMKIFKNLYSSIFNFDFILNV